jgi:N-acetylglucosamine-6-phosphate deacetylase
MRPAHLIAARIERGQAARSHVKVRCRNETTQKPGRCRGKLVVGPKSAGSPTTPTHDLFRFPAKRLRRLPRIMMNVQSEAMLTPGKTALVNGRVILPRAVVDGRALLIEGDRIVAIVEPDSLGADVSTVDVGGRYIAPGLIDIHIHGAVGRSFNEPDAGAWQAITRENARRGVTSLLATIATAPVANLVECLSYSRDWVGHRRHGARVIGVHLEGPYFSYEQRGAQDPKHLRNPDDGSAEGLLAHHDVMRVMSFAPELPGALALTARLLRLGVVPAAGHSSARDSDVRAAVDAGLRHTIHMWSGQSTTVREGPWRKPGLLEATLAFDELTGEIIADNRHLPPTLMKLAYKCLGADRLCAVSDATNGAGLPDGTTFTMGDMTYDIHDGVAMLLDRTSFAGSTTLLNEMIPILTGAVGISLPDAIRMASLTPARVVGIAERKGSLEAGKDADIAIFDDDFSAWRTMIGGEWECAGTA